MKKLTAMTDFVLEQCEIKQSTSEFKESVFKYAKFIKQPLELWMFVPCDDNGNVLWEGANWNKKFYQQAKERCLFEGNFTTKILNENTVVYVNGISFYTSWNKHKTIESLTGVESTLNKSGIFTLTQTAINLLGL